MGGGWGAVGESFGLTALYDLYRDRIAAFLLVAPPADWAGVYTATTK